MNSHQKQPKIFYGWWLVAAALMITLYTGGVVYFGFTAVFEPIADEFGWSYAQISLAASLRGLEVGLLGAIEGIAVDRWGPRRLVFAGGIIVALGLLLLSRVSSLGMFYAAYGLISLGMSACVGTVLVTAVAQWFRKKAGMATGILVSGFGLGGLLIPLVVWLIDILQWRMAMLSLGLGALVVVLPLSLFMRHKPEQYGYLPDGETNSADSTSELQAAPENVEISISARQALKDKAFWQMSFASLCHAFIVGAVVTHIMPYLSNIGITRSTSSLIALILPVASITGRLGVGWLGDKIDRRRVFAIGFTLMTVSMLLFGYLASVGIWLLVPFVIAFSLGWGGNVTTRMALLRDYYGRSRFGTILGFSSGIMMVGHILGAPMAGWIFDTWGSYQGAWFTLALMALAGVAFVATIPPARSTIKQANK